MTAFFTLDRILVDMLSFDLTTSFCSRLHLADIYILRIFSWRERCHRCQFLALTQRCTSAFLLSWIARSPFKTFQVSFPSGFFYRSLLFQILHVLFLLGSFYLDFRARSFSRFRRKIHQPLAAARDALIYLASAGYLIPPNDNLRWWEAVQSTDADFPE